MSEHDKRPGPTSDPKADAKRQAALKGALIEGLALKPRKAFGPIRVAATGTTISPPLFESLELLGRDRSLRRLRAARDGAV